MGEEDDCVSGARRIVDDQILVVPEKVADDDLVQIIA
jgi:hypothetical protein